MKPFYLNKRMSVILYVFQLSMDQWKYKEFYVFLWINLSFQEKYFWHFDRIMPILHGVEVEFQNIYIEAIHRVISSEIEEKKTTKQYFIQEKNSTTLIVFFLTVYY